MNASAWKRIGLWLARVIGKAAIEQAAKQDAEKKS